MSCDTKGSLFALLTCVLSQLALCVAVPAAGGCSAHGHRVVKVTAFGMDFGVEDQVFANDKGEQKYESDMSWFQKIIDHYFPDPADKPAEPATPTPAGGGQ